jgi:DNA-directed RNA polymerase subunit RPC12/RpoP
MKVVIISSIKCPYCGFEGEFKLLKTWRYRVWNVYYYECSRCVGRFGFYLDPGGRCKSFTVKFRPRAR